MLDGIGSCRNRYHRWCYVNRERDCHDRCQRDGRHNGSYNIKIAAATATLSCETYSQKSSRLRSALLLEGRWNQGIGIHGLSNCGLADVTWWVIGFSMEIINELYVGVGIMGATMMILLMRPGGSSFSWEIVSSERPHYTIVAVALCWLYSYAI